MTAQVIDGRKIATDLKSQVFDEIANLRSNGFHCGIATLTVGGDFASTAYARRIGRVAAEFDVQCQHIRLDSAATQDEILAAVRQLNADPAVSGFIVMRPLPHHVDESAVFRALSPAKDIEAVHPVNAGLLALGAPRYVPSTAASVFHILDHWLDEAGEDRREFYHRSQIVVVGRSSNVGKPALALAFERQAAVNSVDEWASRNGRLGWHTRRAHVLIVAAGQPGLIRAEHVRQGAVVIDVGINAVPDDRTGGVRVVGDVAFDEVLTRARAITPVPGGVGPVTDVWLLRNAALAARHLQAEH
ncbi:bifunctional 5,10-methylenetetrahydrofolate dehydrogenase/5,10-methenyltetrahydrofolate cyclohydrolase [Nocardia sp. CA-120079]|uniref:bifunctional 5,10-methylenetetrahydrofolate dehydrogenase/5,10-methenyltetrahydrofolate cyclohydrolase n=1 Tax=Nocardia sp. CA-120079 TaxID=3239974 RepID=UPI003D95F953